MQGKLKAAQIEELLHKQIIGRLGCSTNGTNYIFPISYAYDGVYIYAHTYEGHKLQIMRQNPSVCFEVEQLDTMADWKTVVMQGRFEELLNEADKQQAIKALMQRNFPAQSSNTVKFSKYWPFAPKENEQIDGVFLRIRIIEKQGRYERPCQNPNTCSGNCRVHRTLSLQEIFKK